LPWFRVVAWTFGLPVLLPHHTHTCARCSAFVCRVHCPCPLRTCCIRSGRASARMPCRCRTWFCRRTIYQRALTPPHHCRSIQRPAVAVHSAQVGRACYYRPCARLYYRTTVLPSTPLLPACHHAHRRWAHGRTVSIRLLYWPFIRTAQLVCGLQVGLVRTDGTFCRCRLVSCA